MAHGSKQAQSSPSQAPILFGRDRELAVLSQHLTRTLAGRGSVVLVGGEAGIGKTTLIESVANAARHHGALVLSGHCYDLTATPPYGPWIELLDVYPNDDSLPERPAELAFGQDLTGISSQAVLFQRLLSFIVTVSAVRPLVLVLEDLHWADRGPSSCSSSYSPTHRGASP